MNNDIITQKHFHTQAVIKWKQEKSNFFSHLTNCSIFYWIILKKKFKCTFTHLSISSFRIYLLSHFPYSYSMYVYSMINHCAYIQTNGRGVFFDTHRHTQLTIRSFPVLSDVFEQDKY